MTIREHFVVLGILLFTLCCGVPQPEMDALKLQFDSLNTANEQLISELAQVNLDYDECRFGEEKLIAMIEKAYSQKHWQMAKQNIRLLYEKHPESDRNNEFQGLIATINRKQEIEREKKEAAEKEKHRLENLNNTGIWSVHYYVDEFGDRTRKSYITNTNHIKGTFSNTATENSDLNVTFLISNSSDISIQLYEYARNNPVKAYSTSYAILIQDTENERLKLRASNYSDRLKFDKTASRKVHKALMKGGKLKFSITETDNRTTKYLFFINNADWYENAYRKLKER